ncbi:hypothetical protein [Aquipuribacter sp. MA13-6]|uniref:hypothetical protein n=1 Tax=unclassified Aquipuribacter TaxID=2635084 RepID=UPI003EEDD439
MDALTVTGAQVRRRGDGETVVVEPWGRDSVRVRAVVLGEVADDDWALLPPGDDQARGDVVVEGDSSRAAGTA